MCHVHFVTWMKKCVANSKKCVVWEEQRDTKMCTSQHFPHRVVLIVVSQSVNVCVVRNTNLCRYTKIPQHSHFVHVKIRSSRHKKCDDTIFIPHKMWRHNFYSTMQNFAPRHIFCWRHKICNLTEHKMVCLRHTFFHNIVRNPKFVLCHTMIDILTHVLNPVFLTP